MAMYGTAHDKRLQGAMLCYASPVLKQMLCISNWLLKSTRMALLLWHTVAVSKVRRAEHGKISIRMYLLPCLKCILQDVREEQRAKRKRLLSAAASARIRRGMIRYLTV